MFPENQVVRQMDHVDDVVGVILFQKLEDSQFDARLVVVLLFVLDHFQRGLFTSHVVQALQRSSETALS
jgi:hypothetical protein